MRGRGVTNTVIFFSSIVLFFLDLMPLDFMPYSFPNTVLTDFFRVSWFSFS